jgi:ammonia channel protein AmtB
VYEQGGKVSTERHGKVVWNVMQFRGRALGSRNKHFLLLPHNNTSVEDKSKSLLKLGNSRKYKTHDILTIFHSFIYLMIAYFCFNHGS